LREAHISPNLVDFEQTRPSALPYIRCTQNLTIKRSLPVEHTYDLFEVFPDGSPLWHAAVAGHEVAISKLQELSTKTKNEVRIMDLRANVIVAALNTTSA
jgi:hypothetical protein